MVIKSSPNLLIMRDCQDQSPGQCRTPVPLPPLRIFCYNSQIFKILRLAAAKPDLALTNTQSDKLLKNELPFEEMEGSFT